MKRFKPHGCYDYNIKKKYYRMFDRMAKTCIKHNNFMAKAFKTACVHGITIYNNYSVIDIDNWRI